MAVTTALLIGIIASAVIGGTVGGVCAYNQGVSNGNSGLFLAYQTINGITRGMFAGALVGGFLGYYAPAIGSFLSSSFNILMPTMLDGVIGNTVVASVTGAQLINGALVIGIDAALAATLGIMLFAKPNSGPIRFSDGTGIDPLTDKPVTDKDRAYEIYRSLDNAKEKINWKKWMKGKGWRTNHLK